ncbi:hypothetical protein TNCV_4607991 [Trichonephila clavipes]|nr:hypothetical protein TNCV_4607991 [Trichonephila clavipes]
MFATCLKTNSPSCEKVTAELMKSYAQEEMVKAILDEKPLAESRGDIDSDGYYCITLIVDGGVRGVADMDTMRQVEYRC